MIPAWVRKSFGVADGGVGGKAAQTSPSLHLSGPTIIQSPTIVLAGHAQIHGAVGRLKVEAFPSQLATKALLRHDAGRVFHGGDRVVLLVA
jgi:hypothetical protein